MGELAAVMEAKVIMGAVAYATTMIIGLIGVYVKQIKDIQAIELTMKRDKEETDKEISLLKIRLDIREKMDEKILANLHSISTNQAVTDEKISQILSRLEKQETRND